MESAPDHPNVHNSPIYSKSAVRTTYCQIKQEQAFCISADIITGPSKVTRQAEFLMNDQTILVIGKYVVVNIFAQGGKNSNLIVL